MFHIITNGVGKMPGYARQIDPDDRWKTIHFVRALQRAMNPKPVDMTP
jgi:mono/diheme cytochrome c family protein